MPLSLYRWIGMGGVPSHDSPRAYRWERRLHWLMIGVALLSIPAFLFETTPAFVALKRLGLTLDVFILVAFSAELLWMLWVTQQRALFLVRIIGSLRNLFSPTAVPYVLGLGVVNLAIAGAGFYWLEPTVESYGDGLWLAFTSGATVGYGDIIPTTPASRIFAALMVLVGYAILSMVTASIAAFFVGEDEKHLRRETHHDIKALREEVTQLRLSLEEWKAQERLQERGKTPDQS